VSLRQLVTNYIQYFEKSILMNNENVGVPREKVNDNEILLYDFVRFETHKYVVNEKQHHESEAEYYFH